MHTSGTLKADEKRKTGCDVGVFFLLGNGVKVESLWHLYVCVFVPLCVFVGAPVDRTNLRLVMKLWLFTQQ